MIVNNNKASYLSDLVTFEEVLTNNIKVTHLSDLITGEEGIITKVTGHGASGSVLLKWGL